MRFWFRFYLLLSLLITAPLHSALALDVSALGQLPVLHEGRFKPLLSVARIYAGQLTNQQESAMSLVTQALFVPSAALAEKQLAVRKASLRAMLNLPERKPPHYSYQEVTPKLQARRELLSQIADTPEAERSADERQLWQLYETIDLMTQLSSALSMFIPLHVALPDDLPADALQASAPYSYWQLRPWVSLWQEKARVLAHQKGEAIEEYAPGEQQLLLMTMRLDALESMGRDQHWLRILPGAAAQEWQTPWQWLLSGGVPLEAGGIMQQWQQLRSAYLAGDQSAWDRHLAALQAALPAEAQAMQLRLKIEHAYHKLNAKAISLALYVLAVMLLLLLRKPRWQIWLRCAVLLALLWHGLMLAARMVVLGRPPVTSLYESILFVAIICALLGLIFGWRRREQLAPIIGCALAVVLLAISDVFAGSGDAMAMPIAVLNTQFWLATHVICITAGYGACLMTGSLAHVALALPERVPLRLLHTGCLLSLLLTGLGTILGGIWADQSWGRFWGWDPKENGALLIVLWLVWCLHGRMTRHVGETGFAALLAALNIIVAVSWFGVNLLGVGLHSYGFTSAAALGFFAFCAIEIVLILGLYMRRRRCA